MTLANFAIVIAVCLVYLIGVAMGILYPRSKHTPTDEWVERRYIEIAASKRAATMKVIAKQGSYGRSGCSDCQCSAK